MRTLPRPDMHRGARPERDALRRDAPLRALLASLQDVDRLVLLGDVVELTEGRATRAMEGAGPGLRALGARVGAGAEIVLVPGNHDAPLVRAWLRRNGGPVTVDAPVPADATPALARVVECLRPAGVRVHYPGVWLSERIWATHGHYLDRHLIPESGYGIARGLLGRLPRDGAVPADYERAGGPSLTRLEGTLARRLPRPLAAAVDDLVELLRASTMPVREQMLRRGLAPLTSLLLGLQMRRASIPALARVVHRLGVDADWVVFGHVHRRGPLPGDDLRRWRGPGGRPPESDTRARAAAPPPPPPPPAP